MDRWKSAARKKLGRGESQQGEDKRWRLSEMGKVRREKMQVREKVRKSRNSVFFRCFVAPEGRKVSFWKLRCGESARSCGAKHILK